MSTTAILPEKRASLEQSPVAELENETRVHRGESNTNQRINIPLVLDRWKALDESLQEHLLWFHQHVLDEGLTLAESAKAIGYDNSTVSRVLHGIYEGSWPKIVAAIERYKALLADRKSIQKNRFAHNTITEMIFAGLDYAMANNSITLIVGESRMGKTASARQWRDENNHGRSVLVTAPPYGGVNGLMREIAEATGSNKNLAGARMYEAIQRAFNKNRILLVDEAHRTLATRGGNAHALEILRDLHDKTGCALALFATQRFSSELTKGEYQYEQLLGRIGMPIRLPREIKSDDVFPIVRQYVGRPSNKLITACHVVANQPGRLGILVENLKVASRIAAKENAKAITEEHVFKAFAIRKQMMGEHVYAAK